MNTIIKTAVANQPIGIFDSGMGGLTVLRALKKRLPQESFIYLGDTARLPYGTKSPETVINYASKMADILIKYDIKLLVVACNTATTVALPFLQKKYPTLSVMGVVEPGVQAAIKATTSHQYALLATETTIKSEVYQNKIYQADPHAHIITQPCGLFVALAEENSVDDDVAYAAVKKYITPIINHSPQRDCVILGCTHFPVLIKPIRALLGDHIHIIDSAEATATAVADWLTMSKLDQHTNNEKSILKFLVTDSPERFVRISKVFFGEPIDNIELINVENNG
ncbi:MAG: glutamate racemase [Gammaproteobacteria bacterium]